MAACVPGPNPRYCPPLPAAPQQGFWVRLTHVRGAGLSSEIQGTPRHWSSSQGVFFKKLPTWVEMALTYRSWLALRTKGCFGPQAREPSRNDRHLSLCVGGWFSTLVTAPGEQGGFWKEGRSSEALLALSVSSPPPGRMLWGSPAFSHQLPSLGRTNFLACGR